MSTNLEKGALIRVVKLIREKKQLGDIWLDEDKWLSRKLGVMGLVVGMNPMTNDVYFVMYKEEGKRIVAALRRG